MNNEMYFQLVNSDADNLRFSSSVPGVYAASWLLPEALKKKKNDVAAGRDLSLV